MNDLPLLILMFISGALLATVYLAGLWFTVRQIHQQQHPALWFILSFAVRMGLIGVAFYFIINDNHWQHLLAALAGFVIVRAFIISQVRRNLPKPGTGKEKPA